MDNTFLIGTRLKYTHAGAFGWEDIDEAEHAGLKIGDEVTVCEADNEGIKLEETDADVWISHLHFERAKTLDCWLILYEDIATRKQFVKPYFDNEDGKLKVVATISVYLK